MNGKARRKVDRLSLQTLRGYRCFYYHCHSLLKMRTGERGVVHLQIKDQTKTVQEGVQQQITIYRDNFSRILPKLNKLSSPCSYYKQPRERSRRRGHTEILSPFVNSPPPPRLQYLLCSTPVSFTQFSIKIQLEGVCTGLGKEWGSGCCRCTRLYSTGKFLFEHEQNEPMPSDRYIPQLRTN